MVGLVPEDSDKRKTHLCSKPTVTTMQLHQFANDKGATTIAADRLDDNFRRLRPLQSDGTARQYAITETPNGWALTLFLDQVAADSAEYLPEAIGSAYGLADTLQLIEIERCDGKKMSVLGTGWV